MSEWSLALWMWADCGGYKCGNVTFDVINYETVPEFLEWIPPRFGFSPPNVPLVIFRAKQINDKQMGTRNVELYILQRVDKPIIEIDRLNTYIDKHLEGPLHPAWLMNIITDYLKLPKNYVLRYHVEEWVATLRFEVYGVIY